MQYAVPDLEALAIDTAALTRKRDRLTSALARVGASVLLPEGTFYLWGRWPPGDPEAHWNRLADQNVYIMPGSVLGTPDYFRISLTASEDMVERALPAFAALNQ